MLYSFQHNSVPQHAKYLKHTSSPECQGRKPQHNSVMAREGRTGLRLRRQKPLCAVQAAVSWLPSATGCEQPVPVASPCRFTGHGTHWKHRWGIIRETHVFHNNATQRWERRNEDLGKRGFNAKLPDQKWRKGGPKLGERRRSQRKCPKQEKDQGRIRWMRSGRRTGLWRPHVLLEEDGELAACAAAVHMAGALFIQQAFEQRAGSWPRAGQSLNRLQLIQGSYTLWQAGCREGGNRWSAFRRNDWANRI